LSLSSRGIVNCPASHHPILTRLLANISGLTQSIMAILLEQFPYIWALSILGGLYIVFKLARFGSREKHLPPGPPTYPIVGNAHLVVDKDLYKRLVEFASVF
jgi:hypothetical protein